jgi:flagellar hook-associated protein 2
MGTVGLSFGSPTSGQGIDVSSMVSQIMANYQAVETPWQNQLTALEAQDTAFSSIGNDMSTLSTAFSSLTDFEGVLATMDGSSSDPSILQLTSAGTTAVAGSHTITVNNLAQTSSWATSGTLISASDTLSGSFSVQVGSGTAQTFTLDSSDNTLTSLASAINNAGIGVTADVVTESGGSFLSLVSGTSGSAGNLTVAGGLTDQTASGTPAVNFTQSQAGLDANLVVDGVSLTSPSNTVTNAIPGVTFQLLEANPSTPVQVEITNDTTDATSSLESFVSAYNTVIQDLNTQEGNDSSGNPEPLFGNADIALLQEQLGDAINATQTSAWSTSGTPISATDTLSGSFSIQVGSGNAQTFTLGSSDDTLTTLASAINSADIGVTASVVNGSSGSYLNLVSGTSGTAGNLTVTGSLTDETASGTPTVSFGQTIAGSTINGFGALGITVNDDGTLTLNTDTLNSALNEDYESVVNFFQGANSVGMNFSNVLSGLGSSSPTGVISIALSSDATQESTLNTNISNENSIIATEQTQLTAELNQANQTLQEIPSELSEVNEVYSAITGYNEVQS